MKQAKLFKLITNIFKKHGLSTKHSVICSKAILNAELVGAPSHGVSRIASYCNRIKNKVINAKPNIKIKKYHPPLPILMQIMQLVLLVQI